MKTYSDTPTVETTRQLWQDGFGDFPGFWICNLLQPIPDHPVGSTVAVDTIHNAGFRPVHVADIELDEYSQARFDRQDRTVGCNG